MCHKGRPDGGHALGMLTDRRPVPIRFCRWLGAFLLSHDAIRKSITIAPSIGARGCQSPRDCKTGGDPYIRRKCGPDYSIDREDH